MNKRILKKFHKRFADGEQYLTINQSGEIVNTFNKTYYWQEVAVYNHIKPIIETINLEYFSVINDDLLYGENGLVAMLVPIQRAYNALCNRKTEYINRLCMGTLLVEDGSVDIDALEEDGLNPNGKVLCYRQGANKPEIMYPNVAEFDFFETERQRLLEEFNVIIEGFVQKLELIQSKKS